MKTVSRIAAAAALLLSVGLAGQVQARNYGSGTTPPSTSGTVMGLSVPR